MKKVAILTSGGDAPGMNAAIRAATKIALARGMEVVGIEHGYQGLLSGDLRPLTTADVADIIHLGGTVLGSARTARFREKEGRDEARRVLTAHGIDGLLVIGGNGSLAGAAALTEPSEAGPDFRTRVIGLPASIDNDVGLTMYAIGVDTAVNTIMEACDKISDTASAHERTFIVEVMGRDSGYLAMSSGIAAAADAVLFRESGKTHEEIVSAVTEIVIRSRSRPKGRSRRVLIIKAEGLGIPTEKLKADLDARLKERLGEEVGGSIESRVVVLGHLVRGGSPTASDRMRASRFASVAIHGLMAGHTRMMAAWSPGGPIPPEIGIRSADDPLCTLVKLEAVAAETAQLLDGSSPITRRRAKMFEAIADVLAL